MSAVNLDYHNCGFNDLIRVEGGDVSIDKFGVWSASILYKCQVGQQGRLAPAIYSPSPDYSIMLASKIKLGQKEGFGWVEVDYEGANLPGQDVYELTFSVGEEPIQTHKDFVSTLGGTPASPLNGAFFDPVSKKFVGFTLDPTSQLYLVESYLDADQVTYSRTYLDSAPPGSYTAVGKAGTPDGSPPTLKSGCAWFFLSMGYTRRGYVYQITKQWRASGRRGISSLIYP